MKPVRSPAGWFGLGRLLRIARNFRPARIGHAADPGARRPALAAAIGISFALATMAIAPAAAQPAEPNPPLPHVFLQAGIHRIKAEVADTPAERSRGLMLRKSLQANSGMLFEFERAAVHCFWMKNTLIPLTIAFLDDDGTIVTLADMQPHDESSHCPAQPVRRALEMEQGWFKAKGLKVGDRIK